MTTAAAIIREFDAQQSRKAADKGRRDRSAHRREIGARTASRVLRLAVGAAALGVLVSVVLALA